MDRRIFGLENEYGVTCTFRGQRRLSPDEVARYLFRRVVSWGRSSNVFLRNGARLYLDVGSHPEYATPECDSVIELVTHDKAGERTLEGLLVDAERRLHEEAERLLKAVPPGAVLVALDEAGRQLDSAGLARRIARWQQDHDTVAFAIGGPDGLARSVLDRAQATLAFGRMTWPHRLVRVMLAEQIYRAGTILSGHPYHRA